VDIRPVAVRSPERVATYAQGIKNKTAKTRAPARRPAAKAAAPPKAAPTEAPKPAPPAAPPAASSESQGLRDELQRVNQEISRIARETRGGPDGARRSQLPEKQQLLIRKQDLERKIRTVT
jgi:hypothetical protein